MKLTELINFLTNPERLEDLYKEQGVNTESEALLIYLREALSLESEIAFFTIEETGGDLFFTKDGVQYIALFSVDHTIDLIEHDLDLKNKGYSDLAIAQRLLEYRINDA